MTHISSKSREVDVDVPAHLLDYFYSARFLCSQTVQDPLPWTVVLNIPSAVTLLVPHAVVNQP